MKALGAAMLAGPFLLALAIPLAARADDKVYVIAVGNNRVPPGGVDPALQPLRFADDDAAAFYRFAHTFAVKAQLLAVLDSRSQRRFPLAAAAARMPSRSELQAVVREMRKEIERHERQGHRTHLWFFYSGHGLRPASGAASLTLWDAPLTRQLLYDEVLSKLPARFVHLFVDACHAEAIVRARDGGAPAAERSAQVVTVNERDVREWVDRKTLGRFPNTGAVVASSVDQAAHEWNVYEQGVFTHELLSGLRGAADVNGDARVEYSEIQAFLAAANREVHDPRAKLDVVVRAPPLNLRTPIVNLRWGHELGWLTEVSSSLGRFQVEDEMGRRLADAHPEPGHRLALALPPDTRLFLRTQQAEAEFRLRSGDRLASSQLAFRPSQHRTRGAVVSSLRRGLFAATFGPRYYRGYVDQSGAASVAFDSSPTHQLRDTGPQLGDSVGPAVAAFATAGALTVTSTVLGALMLKARSDYHSTHLQRPAAEARNRYNSYRLGTVLAAGAGAAALGLGLWLHPWSEGDSGTTAIGLSPTFDGVQLSLSVAHAAW